MKVVIVSILSILVVGAIFANVYLDLTIGPAVYEVF